jgi:choline-glycine betaine transporter
MARVYTIVYALYLHSIIIINHPFKPANKLSYQTIIITKFEMLTNGDWTIFYLLYHCFYLPGVGGYFNEK